MLYALSLLSRIIVDIVNVVATSSIQQQIDLVNLTKKVPTATFNPSQFPGAILKSQNPQSTSLVFSSGKIINTGTKSEEQARKATTQIFHLLKDIGYATDNADIQVQNIVASVNYGRQINLAECAKVLSKCMYEPEQFPAVFHRMSAPVATALVYRTGRLICTGPNTLEKILEAVMNLYHQLLQKDLFT